MKSCVSPYLIEHFPIEKQFSGFSKLCSLSYKSSSPRPGHTISPAGYPELQFQFVDCWAGREKWLWRFSLEPLRGLVLVIRGSHIVSDWIEDIHLARAVAGVTAAETRFEDLIQGHYQQILSILETLPNLFEGFPERPFLFLTGHSLGATICEGVLALLSQNHWVRDRYVIRSVTFDTPGSPQSFRERHPIPSEQLVTLNSTVNPINMLTRPTAATFYSAGIGSQVTPLMLWKLVLKKSTQSLLNFFGKLLLDNLMTHPMSSIRKEIESGNFVRESPSQWPLASRWLVIQITRFLQNFDHQPEPQHIPPIPINPNHQTQRQIAHIQEAVQCPLLPLNLEDIQIGAPYAIPPTENFAYPDWPRFCNLLSSQDIVIPLVGMTTVGKTTTLKLLLGLPYDDRQLVTGGGTNNSLSIYVGQYRPGIFIADLPGVGAALQLENNHTFVRNTIRELLYEARNIVACIVYIVNDPISNVIAQQFAQEVRERNIPTLYCHNDRTQNTQERDERLSQIRYAIAPDNPNGIHLVNYSAAYRDVPNGIQPLIEGVDAFLGIHRQEIINIREEQRRQMAADRAERRMQTLPRVQSAPVAEAVTGAGLAVGVWVPGATIWGAAMIKSTTVLGVTIGLGPAIVVGAGIYGVYRLRQRYLSNKRQQFFNEELTHFENSNH